MRQISTNYFIALAFLCAPSKKAFSLSELGSIHYHANNQLEQSGVCVDWKPDEITDDTQAGSAYFRVADGKVHRATKCGRVSVCEALTPWGLRDGDMLAVVNAVLMALYPMGSTLCRSSHECINEDGCMHSMESTELQSMVRPVRWIDRCAVFCPRLGLESK